VAGEPVKPTEVEKGLFRIPLAKSQIQGAGQQGFTVEVVYYLAGSRFTPVGYRSMEFPVPDAPASRLFWSLYLPEKYRFPHFGGDMEKGPMTAPWAAISGAAGMDRDAYRVDESRERNKKTSALRRDLEALASSMGAKEEDHPASRQIRLEAATLGGRSDQLSAGVFPIAFDLPASGQLFHFGQVMIVGQAPRVSMIYLHVGFLRSFQALLWGAFFLALVRKRQAMQRWCRESLLPWMKSIFARRNTVTA